jgi:NAD(P)-dependent dehydrogenase (short-subunit alcohol dehydrogenase family)
MHWHLFRKDSRSDHQSKSFHIVQKRGCEFGQWVLGSAVQTDIPVNNAGTFEPGRVIDGPDGQMEKMMNTNFLEVLIISFLLCLR